MRKRKVMLKTPVYKVMIVHERNISVKCDVIRTPEDAAEILCKYLRGADREHFVAIYLNATNRVIAIHTVSIGILNSAIVHAREVFKLACMMNAQSVIIAHNHPSGNVEPSCEDLQLTRQLVQAGEFLNIPIQDHIIITDTNGYLSFADRGMI